jgi:hypothetical protein
MTTGFSGVVRSFLASGISSRRNRRAEREVPVGF